MLHNYTPSTLKANLLPFTFAITVTGDGEKRTFGIKILGNTLPCLQRFRSGSIGENSVVESEENWEAKPFASSELMEELELRPKVRT